jgi:protocatechuate 3,4-dioxygenase beta subunit
MNGDYVFDTIEPGPVPDPDGKPQAPHILLAIFARGKLLHNYTQSISTERRRMPPTLFWLWCRPRAVIR